MTFYEYIIMNMELEQPKLLLSYNAGDIPLVAEYKKDYGIHSTPATVIEGPDHRTLCRIQSTTEVCKPRSTLCVYSDDTVLDRVVYTLSCDNKNIDNSGTILVLDNNNFRIPNCVEDIKIKDIYSDEEIFQLNTVYSGINDERIQILKDMKTVLKELHELEVKNSYILTGFLSVYENLRSN